MATTQNDPVLNSLDVIEGVIRDSMGPLVLRQNLALVRDALTRRLTEGEAETIAAWLHDYGLDDRLPGVYEKLAGPLA